MSKPNDRLLGKIAVVTGAANVNGIGFAIAEGYAAEGADVVIADIADGSKAKETIERHGHRVFFSKIDVSDQESVEAFGQNVLAEFGGVDVLVNNVGICKVAAFEEATFEDWKRVFAVNVDSQFLMAKAFVTSMKARRFGRIINISSTTFWTRLEKVVPYVASKGAGLGFTRSLASELGEYGITVNAIAPSLVQTDGSTSYLPDNHKTTPLLQSIKRVERPADLVGAALYLASEDSEFMTGQTLVVDGGLIRH
jgi:NAD(P)-dependent dehydrogenase (short-subunit alcohol dehydrogenase family)